MIIKFLIVSIFPSPNATELLQKVKLSLIIVSLFDLCNPVKTIGFICNKQNSGSEFSLMFTANSISTGQPKAFLPMDKISEASLAKGILSHFRIGENETILVPG